MSHNCYMRDWRTNELIYICSRCGECYVCRHKSFYSDQENSWLWKCADGKIRPVIFDGRLK